MGAAVAAIEQAFTVRLMAEIDGLAVEAFPDRPEAYVLKHAKGALLVRYATSGFSAPEPTDVVVQTQTVTVEVVTLVRELRSHEGLYPALEAVRRALTGFRIEGCGAAYPTKEEFVDYAAGVWTYRTLFDLVTAHAEAPRERRKIEFIEGKGYADDRPAL